MDILPLPSHTNAVTRRQPDEPSAVPEIESGALMRGGRELLIRHGESTYRLRVTISNKLILTK
jgi:hemin uptake protein HemP